MKILSVLLLCGYLQPMLCAPAPAEHNHTDVRHQRLFSSNTFDSGDIDVSGHVHGHDVSIGSSVDIKVGESGSQSPHPAPKDVEPKKLPTGLVQPVFTEVPGYKQCLGKENMGSYTRWCFPAHKPEACKHESWAKFSHHKREVDPCSRKEPSGLLPPPYTEVPGYEVCLRKENMGSYTSWCFPAHKPEACKQQSWAMLSHHKTELEPCYTMKPSDLGLLPPAYTEVPDYELCLGKEKFYSYTSWCFPAHKPEDCKQESWKRLSHHTEELRSCSDGLLLPTFMDVPGYEVCLGKENMGSYTSWCFPAHKPEACKHESWAKLSYHTGELEPCYSMKPVLPPTYMDVPGYEVCLKKENLGSYTSWCFPAHKPEACKHGSWLKLRQLEIKGELDPCSGKKPSGSLPPTYMNIPGYELCLEKKNMGSYTSWCIPANIPEGCQGLSWAILYDRYMGELGPCSDGEEKKCPDLPSSPSAPKGPQGPAGASLAYDLLSNTHKGLKYGDGQLGAFLPRTIYHPDNDEQGIYVPSAVSQDPATNVITITAEKMKDNWSKSSKIISGRIDTKGVWSTSYSEEIKTRGYLEVRALMPAKTDGGSYKGAWPAIRMLGENLDWPENGEIDIVELRNGDPSVLMTLHSTNHHGAYGQHPSHNPLHLDTDMTKIPVIFGLEWNVKVDDGQIDLTWWITSFDVSSQQWKNEKITKSLSESEGDAEDYAVFMKSFNEGGFYLLINLAQGGDFTGVYEKDALLKDDPHHVVIESAKVYGFPVVEQKLPGSAEADVMNNIGYIFKGYDIMKGNPLPVDGLSQDPGYRQPIFEASYESGSKTADERYFQPDGTTITDCSGTCSLSFQTVEISGSKSYQDTLSNKASFTLGGYGAKFSASTSYKNVHTTTSQGSNLYTQSSASCCSYTAQTHGYNGPPLSENFLTAVESLTDEYKEDVYQRLIENFGTHYIKKAQMGALYGLQSEISKEAWTNMLEKDLTISTAASVQAYGVAVGTEFSNSNNKKMSEEFKSSVTSQKIFTIGVKPPTDGKLESWVQETSSAPAPMKLRLGSIVDLFDGFHGVEVTDAVKKNMQKALDDYCPLLVKRGEVSSCEAPGPDPPKPVVPMKRTWMGWSNKNFNGHSNPVKQCADGHYVDQMTWMSENNYGIVDLKFSCSDGTIYRMADNPKAKDDRQMNCEGSKGGFRKMTGRRKYNWGIINVRSFCLNQETQQTANDDLRGWWEQTRMCNKDQKIVGIQTQEQGGYGFVNFQFQCAIVPSGTDSGCAKQDDIDYYGNDIPDKNKVVSGLEECINWCGETSECRYWTFSKSDRHCYLKTSNIGVTKDADRISGTKTCATGCVKEGNTDYYGNDIPGKNKIVSGVEECINWCGETTGCGYWTYAKSERHCYLKTSDSGRYENSDRISGTKKCVPGCVREDNTDYYGNDIPDKNKVVIGVEECINWCGETAGCGYWTYEKSDRHCWLKTSDSGRYENTDRTSGTKKCATE